MKIYVGNMNFRTTEDALRELFEAHGAVDEVAVVTDRETGRPRGFGFVTMANDDEGTAAIEALNGFECDGRTLTVNEAKPKAAGGGFGGGHRGGRGGYGGGGGFDAPRGGGPERSDRGDRGRGRDRDRKRGGGGGHGRRDDDW